MLGSTELTKLLNKYVYSIRKDRSRIIKTIKIVNDRLSHFEEIKSYLNDLNVLLKNNNENDLIDFIKGYSIKEKQRLEIIFNRIYPSMEKMRNVITLSRSGTVLGVLKLWSKKNKNIKVVVSESRPNYEGRLTARELANAGINVELITDAMMGIYVPEVDSAIVGADVILKNGNTVNKSGSRFLALLCKEYKRPFFVVTTKSKFSTLNKFKPGKENPKEVYERKLKKLTVSNIYFEEVEKKLITKIFTD